MSGKQGPTKGPSSADDTDTKQTFWQAHKIYIILGTAAEVVSLGVGFLLYRHKKKTQNLIQGPPTQ